MKKVVILLLSVLLYSTDSYASNEPSFTCDNTNLIAEKVICGSYELSALDRKLNKLYQVELSKPFVDPDKLKSNQINWLSSRNECEYGYDCIKEKIKQRISLFNAGYAQAISWGGKLPEAPSINSTQVGLGSDTGYAQAYSWGGKLRAAPSMDSAQVGSIFGKQNIVIIEKTNNMMNGYPWFLIEVSNQQAFQWGGLLCDPNQPTESYCLENE
ncbi:lysozyme inhibitor LprI family protein [Curvivirga sp.]|uniref:lysozyme inhibitor LprI family protein n=1 Tax=Curvivirga sp. TaxID=2856848 RepID=UPI003B5A899A